jgi:hypothetical protein
MSTSTFDLTTRRINLPPAGAPSRSLRGGWSARRAASRDRAELATALSGGMGAGMRDELLTALSASRSGS